MALTQVTGPYPIFTDLDGTPLDDGYLYIGEINEDPEQNPIQVFFDANLTIPATQPIRTSNGYAYRNGTPALLYTAGEFSITIRNKRQEFVLYSPVGYGFDPAAVSASVVKNDFTGDGVEVDFTLSAAPSTILATNVFINGVYQEKDSYTLSGNVITFSIAPPLSSSIEIMTNETGVINAGNATAISYTASLPGATTQTVQTKLEQYVSVKDFGAVGDGIADDTAAIQAAMATGKPIYFPKPADAYTTSETIRFTSPAFLFGDPETRIKLTAADVAVVEFDYTNGGAFFDHTGSMENFVLDGDGNAPDGLSLKGVISANFPNIRVTNVTGAGLHLHWAQLCYFENFTVSDNVEAFTTIPVNGVLADTASCSANTFTNICIEKVSGAGIKGVSLVNSLFLNGTSEGNDTTGIELGETPAAALTAIGNTFVGMDLEVNPTADIICYASAGSNDFIGLKAGYLSGAIQLKAGTNRNFFNGGVTGGFAIDAGADNNTITSVSLLDTADTIVDAGSGNRINDVYNISTPVRLPDTKLFTRTTAQVAAAGSYAINCKTADYVVLEAQGSTMTVSAPTNAIDGQAIDVSIWNTSGGALTVTWDAVFRTNGWINPANGANRSIRFRYNSSFGRWYPIAMSQTDVAN
jgi:hypothetical protein